MKLHDLLIQIHGYEIISFPNLYGSITNKMAKQPTNPSDSNKYHIHGN